MSVVVLGSLLLAVSLISVVIYMAALGQLLIADRPPGMVRTAACRLVAALLYVGVALLTLHTNEKGPLVGLGIFTVVQLMWQFNSVADVALTRKQRRAPVPEHDRGAPPPSSSNPLKEAVVSAEIDRLSGKATSASQEAAQLRADLDAIRAGQRWTLAGLAFTFVVAALGCVLGLTGGEQTAELAERNTAAIEGFKDARDQVVAALCTEHAATLGSYDRRAGAEYPGGAQSYDEYMRRIVISASVLECGLFTPPGLPPR